MGRRGSRRRQLLDVLKGKTGYWKLKDEAIDLTMWRSRFGKKKMYQLTKPTKLASNTYPKDITSTGSGKKKMYQLTKPTKLATSNTYPKDITSTGSGKKNVSVY